MTITYRTSGPWGAGKGSNLTAGEIDGNFYDLDQRVADLESNPPTPDEISNITVSGSQMTVWLVSGAHFGPFTLPQAAWRPPVVATVSGDDYTLQLVDQNRYLRCTSPYGCVVTVPEEATVNFPVSTEIMVRQSDELPVLIVPDGGVEINVPTGFLPQTGWKGAVVRLKKVGSDQWDLWGDLQPEMDTATA